MKSLGVQILADFYHCNAKALNSARMVRSILVEAASVGGATIIAEVFHRFQPIGVSGVLILAESHLAIHTWPEFRTASIDLFTCGYKINSETVISRIQIGLHAERITLRTVKRGQHARSKIQKKSLSYYSVSM